MTIIKIGYTLKSVSKLYICVFIELYITNNVTLYTMFESC